MTTSPDFQIKQGNRLPAMRGRFINPETGQPLDLTGWDVTFRMRSTESEEETVIDRAISADPDAPTYFLVEWTTGETDTAGTYHAEVTATKTGKSLTIPTGLPMIVEIYPAIPAATP